MNFKYGALPAVDKPKLKLSTILKKDLVIPSSEDYISVIHDYQMLGNSDFGDCVAVAVANLVYSVTKLLGGKPVYPSLADCVAFYKSQNPDFDPKGSSSTNGPGSSADGGMNVQDALNYFTKTGIGGKKAFAFAAVDTNNEFQVKQALAIFGAGLVAMDVRQNNETQFDQGQQWTYSSGSPVAGGHCVLGGGENPTSIRFVTWASETSFNEQFYAHQVTEFWVPILAEHLGSVQFIAGIDQVALASEFKALTGRDFPVPPVPVPPVPTTPPTPVPPIPVPPSPVPVAPFPGADPLVSEHINTVAAGQKMSTSQWMNRHFDRYFHITY